MRPGPGTSHWRTRNGYRKQSYWHQRTAQSTHTTTQWQSINGLYKAEVIHRQSRKTRQEVELATFAWVDWYNNRRLLERLGHLPPAEAEKAYYASLGEKDLAALVPDLNLSHESGTVQKCSIKGLQFQIPKQFPQMLVPGCITAGNISRPLKLSSTQNTGYSEHAHSSPSTTVLSASGSGCTVVDNRGEFTAAEII